MTSPRPDIIRRRHGRPMLCPVCGGDVWADAPHVCPEGFVAPARAVLTFYGYNATNKCCRDWMLLGWPDIDGHPKLTSDRGWNMLADYGRMQFACPKCTKPIYFDIAHPDAVFKWDEAKQGKPQPPALVGGRLHFK
jgi:hypothetical protein